jgi:hypothetical protein
MNPKVAVPYSALFSVLINAITLSLILSLNGCVTNPRIESVQDGIAVSAVTIKRVALTARDLNAAGTLSDEQALDVADKLDSATDRIDQARQLVAIGNPAEAKDKLELAESILLIIEQILLEAQTDE